MSHIPATYTVTRDQRQYRKVVCSCHHHIITTDSITRATSAAVDHQQTPECPVCHHRNAHTPYLGCLYLTDSQEGCECTGSPAGAQG